MGFPSTPSPTPTRRRHPATLSPTDSSILVVLLPPCNDLPPSQVSVPAGVAVLGKPVDFPSFGWDNEYGVRKVDVPTFKASKFLVTNAEFLPFVLVRAALPAVCTASG